MGYSAKTLTGIWSGYELDQDKLEKIRTLGLQRDSAFHYYGDDQNYGDIPQPVPAGTKSDYYKANYDRGHMAPNGNMKWSQASVTASFYVTNVAPQNPSFNRESWRCMEQSMQAWADRPGDTFVTVGVLFPDAPDHIGKNQVAVPSYYYAVIYHRPAGGAPADSAIAVLMDNDKPSDVQRRSDWDHHMVASLRSVSALEHQFGLDFAPDMDAEAQKAVEEKTPDLKDWPLWVPRAGEPANCVPLPAPEQ